MNLKVSFIIGLCTTLLPLVIIFLIAVATIKEKTQEEETSTEVKKSRSIVMLLLSVFMIIGVIFLSGTIILKNKALKHGAYTDEKYDYMKSDDVFMIKSRINHTPIDQSKELASIEDQKGFIIYMYRWSCGDCEQVYDKVKRIVKDNNVENFYFVSSRSELGKTIVKTFNITEVPSMVYIRQSGGYTIKYITEQNGDQDHTVTLREDEVMRLIELQQRGD